MATLVNGLGGEFGFGENSVYRNDDGSSEAIDLTSVFPNGIDIFGNTYTTFYVNTNGNITFDSPLSTYTPGTIGEGTTSPIIAPFWADVDTRGGEVSAGSTSEVNVDYSLNAYREYLGNDTTYFDTLDTSSALSNYDISLYNLSSYTDFIASAESLTGISDPSEQQLATFESYYNFLLNAQQQINEQTVGGYNPEGNSKGTDLVWYDLDADTQTITVTWDDVGYYSYHTDKTNAFQLQLINTGDGNFDMKFIYEDINWTTGDMSYGVNGLGGIVARAGYSAGDGEHYLEFPYSGNQSSMLNMENNFFSSTEDAGVWVLSSQGGNFTGIGLEEADDELVGSILSDYLDGRSGDDFLNGEDGDDTLNGGDGNDRLEGGAGNDVIFTGSGNDIVYGGTGLDRVVYQDRFNHYDFTDAPDHVEVVDDAGTSEDALYEVEEIQFGDVSVSADHVVELLQLEEAVTRLYTALLGRNPDNAGLTYWLNDIDINGNTLQDASGAFAGSEEYLARFGAQSNTEFINQLYNNILGRDADAAGYDYWLNEIENTGDRTGMIVSFSNSDEYETAMAEAVGTYLDNVDLSGYGAA